MARHNDRGSETVATEGLETKSHPDRAFADHELAHSDGAQDNTFLCRFTKKRVLLLALALVAAFAVLASLLRNPPPAPFEGLDTSSQQYIWHAEHIAFELETHFGKPLTKAMAKRDLDALRSCCLEPFEGTVLDFDDGTTRRHGIVSEVRSQAGTASRRGVDAAGFAGYLVGLAGRIERIQGAKLRVLHNDLVDVDAGRWEVRFLLALSGSSSGGEPVEVTSEHRVTCVFAGDEDIRARRVIARWHVQSQAFRRSQQPLMEEVTEQLGLAGLPLIDNWKIPPEQRETHRRQIAVEDFDRDGFLDIAVATAAGKAYLLRSVDGQRFENVADQLGVGRSAVGTELSLAHSLCAWIDYDNDTFPDLLVGRDLYHNEQGKKFVRVADNAGLQIGDGPMGVVVADYDADGWLDLYVNQVPVAQEDTPNPQKGWVGDDRFGAQNQLWRNERGKRFRDVTAEAVAGGGLRQTFAATWLFADGDAWPDLYLANDFGENVLLRNRGDGRFDDITRQSGSGDFATSMGVAAGDLDNDGTPEIYVANMFSKMGRRIIAHVNAKDYPAGVFEQIKGSCAGNRLYRLGVGQTRFEEISEAADVNAVGWAFGPAMGDLDGDGLLDLYATAGYISSDRHKPDG